MQRITTEDLREIPAYAQFPQEELIMMIRLGHPAKLRTLRSVSYQKESCTSSFLILSGKIEKILFLAGSRSVKIGVVGRGDWIGVPELLMEGTHLYDSRTMEKTNILQFTPQNFHQLMTGASFNQHITGYLSREIILLHHNMEYNTPRSRILQLLKERVVVSSNGKNSLIMTQEQMAVETGTTRETVNRCLKELERAGILITGRGFIEIPNLEELDLME
jgi:CRP-like cAMP-binding protein